MLEKLTFKIGDKEIELTKLEAYKLQNELNELLGNNHPVWIPYIPYQNPVGDQWPPSYPWCGGVTVTDDTTDEFYIKN